MLKNIVFDMGMVLLVWNPLQSCLRHCDTQERAQKLNELIFTCPDWPKYMDTGAMHEDEYLNYVLSKADEADKPYIRKILSDYWLDALYPVAGMEQLVEELLNEGYRIYLLSNVGYRFHDYGYKIRHMPRFSGVLLSSEQKMIKPSPKIFERLCELYQLNPQECLFVDDVEANVNGARAIGMQGVRFTGSPACVREAIAALQTEA